MGKIGGIIMKREINVIIINLIALFLSASLWLIVRDIIYPNIQKEDGSLDITGICYICVFVILWIIVIFKLNFIIAYYHMRIGAPMIKGTPGSGKAFRTVPSLTGEILEKNGVEKSTINDYFTSDTNRGFIRWSIDKMLSDEFNRKWKYNEYNESSIKLIRLGAFDGYHQAIIDILTFIHTNMSDEELHNPLVWKLCMFINYFGKWAPMLELCNKLNTLLFEKTEENEKKIKQLIRENITEHPGRKIFYDENLYSEDKSLEAVIRKKSMFFVPTEDQKFSPGIIVKYRKKEH